MRSETLYRYCQNHPTTHPACIFNPDDRKVAERGLDNLCRHNIGRPERSKPNQQNKFIYNNEGGVDCGDGLLIVIKLDGE